MADYELWMTNSKGVRLSAGPLNHSLGFTCSKVANNVGRLEMRLPVNFSRDLIIPDSTMVQVWRTPPGGASSLWNTYNIDGFEFSHSGSIEKIEIYGADMMDILRRRIVAYLSNSAHHGVKTADEADDIMKDLINENYIDPLYTEDLIPDPDRDVSDYLSIAADLAAGVIITGEWAWGDILRRLIIISNMSRQGGTEVFFDIVPDVIGSNSMTWKFITKTGQPGADLTSGANQVVFSQERKNMINPSYSEDWADSVNYAYAAGRGIDSAKIFRRASDSAREKRGIWARRESLVHAMNQGNDADAIQDVANSAIDENRPVIRFTAEPISLPGSRFGVDWNWGDKVISKYLNFEFETIIRAVQIIVTPDGGERVRSVLDWRAA